MQTEGQATLRQLREYRDRFRKERDSKVILRYFILFYLVSVPKNRILYVFYSQRI